MGLCYVSSQRYVRVRKCDSHKTHAAYAPKAKKTCSHLKHSCMPTNVTHVLLRRHWQHWQQKKGHAHIGA